MNKFLGAETIKAITPPIIWEKFLSIKRYRRFSEYKDLVKKNVELHGLHTGNRCFILGSGPSIKTEDLKPLKNEIVFALNNFYVHNDFQTIMRGDVPKYYMTAPIHRPQTENEWKSWFEDMEKNMPRNTIMLFGLDGYKGNIKHILDKYNLFKENKIFWYFAGVEFDKKNFSINAMDLTKSIYLGEAVSIYALIAAIYMGFDEIYLLGMDHDYFLYDDENQMRMYKKALHQNNELFRSFGDEFYTQEFLRQYKIFSKYQAFLKHSNQKIYNASSGGILKVFQKVKFQSLFNA